ncbi:MAG: SusC/RagA family TonB-linked outer membrane protein [Balneolaceae bacterium]|nr:MAG: SusC/RagA family TonB-linked outer membrane protein [Balneolaceae bacterium]
MCVLLLFAANFTLQAQERTITGTVTFAEDDSPLPGANVVVMDTQIGTVTDVDGNYSLTIPEDTEQLQFSYVGMQTQLVAVPEDTDVLDVALRMQAGALDELVVTAFGIPRERKSLGYAIQDIQGDVLLETREVNLANSLTGKVSGLQVIRSSTGPAGSSQIVLRGHSSITGDNQPLIVVDGIPINNFTGSADPGYWGPALDMGNGIGDINMEDIESMSVLKGASAAALYGARAGNGVILITTKSGQSRPGLGMTFSSSIGIEQIFANPDMQSTFGQGTDGGFDNRSNSSWGPRITAQNVENWDGRQVQLAAYDNVDNFFDTGVSQNYNLSFQQGFENTSIYTSVTRRDESSMIPGTELTRTNLSTRAVTTFGTENNWSIDAKVQYLNAEANNRPILGHNQSNPYFTLYRLPVSMDIRQFDPSVDENGNMIWYGGSSQLNPYWSTEFRQNRDTRDRFILQATLSHQFADWIGAEVTAGSDLFTTNTESKMFAGGPLSPNGQFSMGKNTFHEHNFSYLITASQDNVIDRLGISGNLGGNVMMQQSESISGNAGQLEVPNLFALNNSTTNPTVNESFSEQRILSLYGTLEFNWDNYFYLEGTLRNDWASTLSVDNRSFMYPSVSASLVVSDMLSTMDVSLPSWITFARLRASVAQVGNALGPYQLFNTFSIGNDPLGNTTADTRGTLFNPNVKSELITSREAGFDLRFFDGRFGIDFTWYQSNSTNQLIPIPMDPLSGFNARLVNAGDIENKGVELMVDADIIQRQSFIWNTSFNFSTNRNRIIELHENVDFYRLGGFDNLSIRAETGELFGEIVGTGFRRVDDESSPYYGQKILDGNGFPTAEQNVRLGNQQASALMGVTNSFGYRGLRFSFLVDARIGGEIFSQTNQQMQLMGTAAVTAPGGERENIVVEGVVESDDGSFSPNSTEITQQQYWSVVAGLGNLGIHEANIYDATNVRLRYINLDYDLPGRFLENIPVQRVRVGATVNNVWLISSNLNGYDPESVHAVGTNALGFESAAPPTTRTFLFNLTISY